jgi:uncharacterized protein (TIGR03663 family)
MSDSALNAPVENQVQENLWNFFSAPQWGLFCVLVAAGLLLRWVGLDVRPLHHDESLHAMWGKYFFDHPDVRFYKYDPMLHGPLLYNTLFFTYFSLGDSDWSARFPAALIGSCAMLLPFGFRKFFLPRTVLLLTGFVAVSPTLIYWSRFIRHDPFVLLGIFTALYGALVARGSLKVYLVSIGFAIQFCAKENSYVHLAILVGYLIFEPSFCWLVCKRWRPPWGMFGYLRQYWIQTILAVAAFMLIYALLFGAWGLYPEGILDGLYRKSIFYWWEQSAIERIKGPFMFHYYVLSFYESVFVLAVLVQMGLFYCEAPAVIRILGGVVFVCASGGWIYYASPPAGTSHENFLWLNPVWKFLKLKHGFDVFGSILFGSHAVLLTAGHLVRRERCLAVTGYFFTALLFSYSYLGEKVPWLTLYPFLAGVIYLALYYQDYFTRKPLPQWRESSVGKLFFVAGAVLLALGIVFILEQGRTKSHGEGMSIVGWLAANNLIFVGIGTLLATLGIFDQAVCNSKLFGRVNLLKLGAIVAFVYMLRASALTNFVYAGNERELLSQVHTAQEALDVMRMIEYEVVGQPRGYQPHIYVSGDAVWPMTWYFRKLPTYDYLADVQKRNNFLFRIENWEQKKSPPRGYTARRINLRGWWLPDFSTISLKKFLHYAINHEPWNPPGFAYVNLYYRNSPEGTPLVVVDKH